MSQWKNIPAAFKWTEAGLVPSVRTAQQLPPQKPLAPKVPQASIAVDDFGSRLEVAALRTEAALESILGMVNDTAAAVLEPPMVVEEKPEAKPEASLEQVQQPPKQPLWDESVQTLPISSSPIYPAERPVANPNHLMMFIGNGAEVVRSYTSSGWVSRLRRLDGKENPVPNQIIDGLVMAGQLKETKPGVFRGR